MSVVGSANVGASSCTDLVREPILFADKKLLRRRSEGGEGRERGREGRKQGEREEDCQGGRVWERRSAT